MIISKSYTVNCNCQINKREKVKQYRPPSYPTPGDVNLCPQSKFLAEIQGSQLNSMPPPPPRPNETDPDTKDLDVSDAFEGYSYSVSRNIYKYTVYIYIYI